MKNLFLTVILLLKIFWVNAQNISVNYSKGFLLDEKILFNSIGNVTPQTVEQITVGYSKYIGKSYFYLDFAASVAANRPPPRPQPILPCPECTVKGSKVTPKGSIIGFLHPQSTSVNLVGGLGYTIPHKVGSRLTFSLNVDGGVAINSDQDLQIVYDGTVLESIAFEKYQPIINPSLKMKVALSNRIGINLGGGYSNIGGVSLISGLNFNVFSDKKRECLHWECCGSCRGFDRGNY
jgi:hypothetical protein